MAVHVVSSVGWLGSVCAYLALDVAAVTSRDIQLVRSAYVAMELIAYSAIVPLALATVVIGLLTAWSTPWGVLRHYWVIAKLLLTLLATAVLLVETQTIGALADAALATRDPRELAGTLPHSIGGLIVLLTATVLSIFKPKGTTRYGWRKQQEQRRASAGAWRPTTS
ncbi:hypothetical protein [Modestobacter muralis]|uniref:hypothetical protein n=1 Tax=Modestobacter muralis TaxID=1608614 RepID=UPI001B8BE6DF|nr:hypothetical protein [Modestobacter muralis]